VRESSKVVKTPFSRFSGAPAAQLHIFYKLVKKGGWFLCRISKKWKSSIFYGSSVRMGQKVYTGIFPILLSASLRGRGVTTRMFLEGSETQLC